MDEVNKCSLELFNAVIEQTGPPDIQNLKLDNDEKLEQLLKEYGVVVTPEARYAIDMIKPYIEKTRVSVKRIGATFYTCWEKVMELTPLERLLDQLLHYASTYGTNFSGEMYLPASALRVESKEKLPLFVVGTIPKQQACDKAVGLLKSGTALKQETIAHVITLLRGLDSKRTSLDGIRNKEARVVLMKEFQLYDVTPEEFLRFLVNEATGVTLLIKSKSLVERITKTPVNIMPHVEKYPHVESLATIFNRFKPLFLAFKLSDTCNVRLINRISKLSKKKHIPLATNPLNCVTSRLLQENEYHWLKNATTAALLRALNSCKLASVPHTGFVYHIRNGKSWVSDRERSDTNIEAAKKNFEIISQYFAERIGESFKGKKVYIPPHVEYGLPVSEKQLVGNIPLGTKITTRGENLVVGISWKPEYKAKDLDLSATLLGGQRVGWNASYNIKGVTHSGDMTSFIDRMATEYLLIANNDTELSLQILSNVFSGSEDHCYDIIVGRGDNISREYMMNPANLIFSSKFHGTKRQTNVGVVLRKNNEISFVFCPSDRTQARVSSSSVLNELTIGAMKHNLEHSLGLYDVLATILGCEMVDSPDLADLDLSVDKMNKDFFNLLTAES